MANPDRITTQPPPALKRCQRQRSPVGSSLQTCAYLSLSASTHAIVLSRITFCGEWCLAISTGWTCSQASRVGSGRLFGTDNRWYQSIAWEANLIMAILILVCEPHCLGLILLFPMSFGGFVRESQLEAIWSECLIPFLIMSTLITWLWL